MLFVTVGTLSACPQRTAMDIALAASEHVRQKTIVITGGDTGLGFETAKALAAAGARLIILSHSITKGTASAKRLPAMPVVIQCDMSSFISVRRAAKELLSLPDADQISVKR